MPRTKKIDKEKKSLKKYKAIHSLEGTKDVLPQERFFWNRVSSMAESMCSELGFERIDIPVLESRSLYQRTMSDFFDDCGVSLEMGKEKICLRPDGTSGVVRAYVENEMSKWPQPVKLFYKGPMFRFGGSKNDKKIEHHRFGVEVFGESSPATDAQVIYLAWKIFKKIGFENIFINVNSVGCSSCRNKYKKTLTSYYEMKFNKLCSDCRKNLEKNPIKLLNCKEDKCLQTSAMAPQIIDNLCSECHDHLKSVLEFLDELDIPYVLSPGLVGDFEYYNRTVFEIVLDDGKKDGKHVLGSGGRYDDLVRFLGGEETSAIGFSFDLEKVVNKAILTGVANESFQNKDVFLVQLGDMARKKIMKIFDKLIDSEISVGESLGKGGIKGQLRNAGKVRAKLALIVGQKEALDDTVIIRDMNSGMQETVMMDDIVKEVKRMLRG